MRPLWFVAVLAACDTGPAFVDLRITAPGDVQRVELYMAQHACADDERVVDGDCPQNPTQLAWDTAHRKMDGEMFVLDIAGASVADRLDDGTYRIDIQREEMNGHDQLERLLLVGYPDTGGTMQPTAAAMLRGVKLPLDTPEQWNIELASTSFLPPTDLPAPKDDPQRVRFWNRRDGATLDRCIVMERWKSGGAEVQRDFLVPYDDVDCDGLSRADECDPRWWNQPTPLPVGVPNCTTKSPLGPSPSDEACQLGATVCSETQPSAPGEQECAPVAPTYCLATSLCEKGCTDAFVQCFESGGLAQLYCDIPTNSEGGPCQSNADAFASLSALAASPLADCGLPEFAPIPTTFPPLPSFSNPGMVGFVQLTATESATMSTVCSADISWTGTATTSSLEYGLAKVPLPNGTSAIIGVVLKMHFNSCTMTPMSCYPIIAAGDSATRCGPLP